MAKPRVVTKPQAVMSPATRIAHLYGQSPIRKEGHTQNPFVKRDVDTIFEGPSEVEESRCECDRYAWEARSPPRTRVHAINSCPPRGTISKPKDIIFNQADAS